MHLAEVGKTPSGSDNGLHPMNSALAARAAVGEVCDALREAWQPTPLPSPSEPGRLACRSANPFGKHIRAWQGLSVSTCKSRPMWWRGGRSLRL